MEIGLNDYVIDLYNHANFCGNRSKGACSPNSWNITLFWLCIHFISFLSQFFLSPITTRAVLSPGNRAKPCKFRYVKSVRNFMWKLYYRKDDRTIRPIRGCPENFRDSLTTPTATIPKIFHGLLFRLTLWMFLQNLKSVTLPVSEIIGGTRKVWAAPGYAHAPFSPQFLWAFIRIDPVNVLAKFEVRSFTRSWDNRGYPKNLGSPWIRPRSLFSKLFMGFYSDWPGCVHAPFSLKLLNGFYSEWPCKYIPQIWSP